jgi:nucleoside-diphosphate-sugar epimerase
MHPVSILITGASGFVGSSLCRHLLDLEYPVVGLTRKSPQQAHEQQGPELAACSDWSPWLKAGQVVIHCAARVHVMHDIAQDPYQAFRTVNVDGTLALAKQAAAAGVKRFVFISSIKVNGETTELGQPFTETVITPPTDPYGLSKYEAEHELLALSASSAMEVVIIRPPLIYGAGVKGNFASIISLLAKGYPLPLGAIHNKRSLLSLDNLSDFITMCINHPAAANQIFLVSDGDDLSTTELLNKISIIMKKKAILLPIPEFILRVGALLIGKKMISQRLFSSLQVDITKGKILLNWVPAISVNDGLNRCVANHNKDK